MNRIRKPTFHAARYNWVKYLGSDVRSRPLQSAPTACFGARTVVILHREQTRPRKPYRGILRTSVRNSPVRIFPIVRWEQAVPLSDKLAFVRQRCSLCEAGRSPQSNTFLTDIMDTDPKLTDMTGKKPRTASYKYSFRLNEEQNIRFNELLCKAGSEHNRSRFIVKRIFAEEFVVRQFKFFNSLKRVSQTFVIILSFMLYMCYTCSLALPASIWKIRILKN